jgi:hypothetical protein
MARFNWNGIRTENKIRRYGQERIEPAGALTGTAANNYIGTPNEFERRRTKRHDHRKNIAAAQLNFLHLYIRAQLLRTPTSPSWLRGNDVGSWARQQPQYQDILAKTRRQLEAQGKLKVTRPSLKSVSDLREEYKSEINGRYEAIVRHESLSHNARPESPSFGIF